MLSDNDYYYMQKLEKVVVEIKHNLRCRHAAFLVEKNKIISIGMNKEKSHPLQKEFSRFANMTYLHAEIDCLKSVGKFDLNKTTLYILRIDKNGQYANSAPCKGCQEFLNQTKIRRIVYSVNNGINIKLQ
jgi:deoxycytidylate deaminase